MPAFQLIEDLYSDGLFGTDAFGTSAFGGPDYPPEPLELHYPGDDLGFDAKARSGRIEHRRYGLLVGARNYATTRRWRVVMQGKTEAEVTTLRTFYDAVRFYLLQDDDETGRKVEVVWLGEFNPQHRRGGWYDFDFTIEEVLT